MSAEEVERQDRRSYEEDPGLKESAQQDLRVAQLQSWSPSLTPLSGGVGQTPRANRSRISRHRARTSGPGHRRSDRPRRAGRRINSRGVAEVSHELLEHGAS